MPRKKRAKVGNTFKGLQKLWSDLQEPTSTTARKATAVIAIFIMPLLAFSTLIVAIVALVFSARSIPLPSLEDIDDYVADAFIVHLWAGNQLGIVGSFQHISGEPIVAYVDVPSLQGNRFRGFSYNDGVVNRLIFDEFGNRVSDEPWIIERDVTLVSSFIEIYHAPSLVGVYLGDGLGVFTEFEHMSGDYLPATKAIPVRLGYLFVGYRDGNGVLLYDASGGRIFNSPWYVGHGATITAEWAKSEYVPTIFRINLFANRGCGFEDNQGFIFRTTDPLYRLTARDLVYEIVNNEAKNDTSRLDEPGYERIAWTRVRQDIPFYGIPEEASAYARYNMGGKLMTGMRILDIFNCPVWRLNIRVVDNEVILDVFAFWLIYE